MAIAHEPFLKTPKIMRQCYIFCRMVAVHIRSSYYLFFTDLEHRGRLQPQINQCVGAKPC